MFFCVCLPSHFGAVKTLQSLKSRKVYGSLLNVVGTFGGQKYKIVSSFQVCCKQLKKIKKILWAFKILTFTK